ncbi:VPA1269 family protein [Mesorhizobium sp. VK23B]|uniref:VPA1269 family protein n=1 Tax=Mesorhizobium dulcispinae TaxID=3072316 RepID=A0ABU4X9R3_9HYPH|nr:MULTISPECIES: VPA1269 family protein [unclassified Mesorhizobium]MDX8465659.1 VPA1269 family protein [Mesorhizobium sp. VK23B]MDX8471539.1 VPA1269 family protein [Mesorhizobium sp. VK23A]
MKLEFRNDDNLMTSDKEAGSYFNATDRMVLLRVPDVDELRQLWAEFDRELRTELKDLLMQPYGDIAEKLGRLNFTKSGAEERNDKLFGMVTQNAYKSAQFSKPALFRAAIALDLVPDKKPNGQARKRMARGEGPILDQVLAMSRDEQKAIIETIVDDHENLDEWMLVSQGTAVGWQRLRNSVKATADVAAFLDHLADEVDLLMGSDEQRTVRFANPDEKIEFAPTWFAQFLAKRKVWVWPARYAARMAFMYPTRFSPLIARMSVPAEQRDFADLVFRYHQNQRHTGAAVSLQAFATAALCGNAWDADLGSFRWYPLVAFKERATNLASANHIQGSINACYKLAVEHGGGTVKRREEAHFFLNNARLALTGVDAFNWTLNPSPRNTQVASRLLGRPVKAVPDHVKSWAAQLRALLPSFGVKYVKQVENALNSWLIYLMTLDPRDAPLDFQTIDRNAHVHDLGGYHTGAFWNFLDMHYAKDNPDRGNRAISMMNKAFLVAAVRDKFKGGNPFDIKLDRVGGGYSKRSDVTHRMPLALEAWELIVRKNRESDYGFARSLGPKRFHYTLRNPDTGEYENVFWPAEAIVVDIILNSGMRHISARWADSGEGDAKRLDREKMIMVTNDHPAATVGRSECYLQLEKLPGRENRKTIGQLVGINKTGKPYVIPWVDPAVIDGFYRMLALQTKYNPIQEGVKPIKAITRELTRANPDLFPDIFPLFRDPGSNGDKAVSDTKVLAYWKDLLRHCQADINELFGYEYPLISDEGLVFDLHALRVTMVTHLLEAGVSIEIVRDLVGHATAMMTWHYNAMRSAKMNIGIQEAMNRRVEAHAKLAARDKDAIEQYAAEAVVPDFIEDHVGANMLRNYAKRKNLAPFEIFLHGICPGGSCETGGQKASGERFQRVWRERACSGCRYRVTGPRFKHGIQSKINSLMAELRLTEERSRELGLKIEEVERKSGKEDFALRGLQQAERRFKDQLADELGKELIVQKMVHEVEDAARAAGKSADNLLLPAVPGFDPSALSYGFSEVHEFELYYGLTKEMRILPAAIMEVPHGVETKMKKLLKAILRANNIAELLAPLSDREETDACLLIGDKLLERYPEASEFQRLVEGAIKLDHALLEDVRAELRGAIASAAASRQLIGYAA